MSAAAVGHTMQHAAQVVLRTAVVHTYLLLYDEWHYTCVRAQPAWCTRQSLSYCSSAA